MNLDNTNLLADMHLTGFEPIIAKNVQKINFKFTMISIFTTLFNKNNTISSENTYIGSNFSVNNGYNSVVTVFTTNNHINSGNITNDSNITIDSAISTNSAICTDKCTLHYVQ